MAEADDLLVGIDEAFARAKAQRDQRPRRANVLPDPPDAHFRAIDSATTLPRSMWRWFTRTPWVEMFIAVQFLWGVLLFIPGAQPYRGYIRALPYLSSLGLLALFVLQPFAGRRPKAGGLMVGALILLALNLLHPTSQLSAGLAQCVFQVSIAGPIFWAYKTIRTPQHFHKLLVLIFLMNFASAALGVLQVYFPDRFMPPQFNSLGLQLNPLYVESLSYVGPNGTLITRPPGLTDQPGGAAVAGGLTALLGLGLSLRSRKGWQTIGLLCAIAVGLAVVYLTQVRAVLLTVIGAGAVLGVLTFRQGRVARASWILAAGGALIVASFWWASSIGGAALDERFLTIRSVGAFQTYQENRGGFLTATVGELLDEYPLGAGVGRWGMMNVYFGNPTEFRSAPIHAEIQLTGWLLDGGVPMWVLYGGAVLLTLLAGFRLTGSRDQAVGEIALIVLTIHVFVVGFAMASPPFNTQLGIMFWTLAAGLHGAARAPVPKVEGEETPP